MVFDSFWVYLAASPLWWLTLTILVYLAAQKLFLKSGSIALLNPVAVSIVALIVLLELSRTSYDAYFAGAQFLHFLLGPATVALAVPLFRQMARLRAIWFPVTVSLAVGVLVGAFSAVAIGYALGLDRETLISLAPKSVTTPVAMGISEVLGGIPAMTAAFVVFTGITGAVIGLRILKAAGVTDESAVGVAMGVTAHGVGTARAFEAHPVSGAFAGLAMALAAFLTALLLPPVFEWMGWL
ncbi:LrgB family protein [Sulfurimonas sp. HSL-3221]|uniref:LrgB family protein n=1 Tax=Sulfurimonadaceae TaxID=2771471 RepID=UPI001E324621|nr:LrgB family protein [Sulfurimonas sp. HSL-3221]UFS61466.1 LrgB family protein [Sulfurimonas sp. HSL-3221]